MISLEQRIRRRKKRIKFVGSDNTIYNSLKDKNRTSKEHTGIIIQHKENGASRSSMSKREDK